MNIRTSILRLGILFFVGGGVLGVGDLWGQEAGCTGQGCGSQGCASKGCGSAGNCGKGIRGLCTICGHKKSELPILANQCYGYFRTEWREWPCPTETISIEKEMPKESEEPPVKPAVHQKSGKSWGVIPAVRSRLVQP